MSKVIAVNGAVNSTYRRQSWKIPWLMDATVSFIREILLPAKKRAAFSSTESKMKNGNIWRERKKERKKER